MLTRRIPSHFPWRHRANPAVHFERRSEFIHVSQPRSRAAALHQRVYMGAAKCGVYILKSESDPNRYYTGLTSNVSARLVGHNAGRCAHTASGRPWSVDVVVEFADERRAAAFERYLKSGSGSAFAKRHFR